MSLTTENRFKTIVAGQMMMNSQDHIQPESSLKSDLGADELDRIEIAFAVEDEFNISVELEEWDDVDTVEEAIELIESSS